jgi:hypothetical protein
MKKFICLIFLLFSVSVFANEFAGGSGTEDDPYLISTPEQLKNLGKYRFMEDINKCFRLINDIDLGVPPWNQGSG